MRPRDQVLTLVEGQSVELDCQAASSPPPEVVWLKNGRSVDGLERIFVWEDFSLNVRNLQASDTGTYTCVATNPVGNATLDYKVTVQCKAFHPSIVDVLYRVSL